jgi:virginiamycin B lyase
MSLGAVQTRAARRRGRAASGTASALVAVVVMSLASTTDAADAASPITEYGPVPSSIPIGGVCETEFDQNGKLWVEQYASSQMARFDTKKNTFD